MSPGSSTDSYPAFAHIGLRKNPGKNINQFTVTCPDRDSNPSHLVSRPDALTVTPQSCPIGYNNSPSSEVPVAVHLLIEISKSDHLRIRVQVWRSYLNLELRIRFYQPSLISKWADNRQATNFECTLTPCDFNCGFLLTNSDMYYANQDFRSQSGLTTVNVYIAINKITFLKMCVKHHCINDAVSTTRLFGVDGIGDSEMVFGEVSSRQFLSYLGQPPPCVDSQQSGNAMELRRNGEMSESPSFTTIQNNRPNRNDRDDIEIQTAEPFIPEPTLSEVEIAIENLKKYKSPGIDQIPAELIQEGGSALYSEIYKLVLAIWEKEIVPEQWKESIIVPIFKKGDKTNCGNFRGISLLLTSYKILSNILLRRLTPYVDEIIGDHQCGFRRNRSTIDQIFCIRQIMEKKWEYKIISRSMTFVSRKKSILSRLRTSHNLRDIAQVTIRMKYRSSTFGIAIVNKMNIMERNSIVRTSVGVEEKVENSEEQVSKTEALPQREKSGGDVKNDILQEDTDILADRRRSPSIVDDVVLIMLNSMMGIIMERWEGKPFMKPVFKAQQETEIQKKVKRTDSTVGMKMEVGDIETETGSSTVAMSSKRSRKSSRDDNIRSSQSSKTKKKSKRNSTNSVQDSVPSQSLTEGTDGKRKGKRTSSKKLSMQALSPTEQ
ncbi:hypothetical protein ANN_00846 [Periplaneta americana]|uniref:Reverse transcriptase domain-containing protein n=1 Tax=Periplaneta americana TaxID=6978 RepID=A0ABQ8TUT1_PERAM|nr:hypothetical protein ANN_00846 [Periplaneta americana]